MKTTKQHSVYAYVRDRTDFTVWERISFFLRWQLWYWKTRILLARIRRKHKTCTCCTRDRA